MKAKYKGKCREKYSRAVHLFYEYRGREYMVTDMHNGIEDLAQQHEYEQRRIDREIDEPQYTEHGTFDLDEIWNVLQWD